MNASPQRVQQLVNNGVIFRCPLNCLTIQTEGATAGFIFPDPQIKRPENAEQVNALKEEGIIIQPKRFFGRCMYLDLNGAKKQEESEGSHGNCLLTMHGNEIR